MAVQGRFLVTTARNEAPYFLEWVAHHLEVGFTDIVIFQNDSDDLTHETLSVLRSIGAVQYFYGRGAAGQHKPHAHMRAAKLAAYAASDWAIFLDMDEFLVVRHGDGTLTDLLNAAKDCDSLHVPLRSFGHSGYETITDQLVTERFAMAANRTDDGRHLFRPALFERPGQHPDVVLPLARRAETPLAPDGRALAQINRYTTRDIASFMLKTAKDAQQIWTRRNTNHTIDDSTRPFLARVKARMAALNAASNGQLMDLRDRAIFTHMARYYTLLQNPEVRALRLFCKATPNAAKTESIKAANQAETRRLGGNLT
jgi:hypothetical protein